MSEITDVHARQILDSRGNPTIEVDVHLESGNHGRAAVPAGSSTGSREASELRDNDDHYRGRGVSTAISLVNDEVAKLLTGRRPIAQDMIDAALIELDGTPDKSRLGANSILAVSLACARAASNELRVPLWQWLQVDYADPVLPMPMLNVLNGGVHADNGLDFQEYLILPLGARDFPEAIEMSVGVYQSLRDRLRTERLSTGLGDEGGFAPNLESNEHALEFLLAAIEDAGYEPGPQVALALDPAASEFFDGDRYELTTESRTLSRDEMVDYWDRLTQQYPIVSLEDPMAEDDWLGWSTLTERIGGRLQLVGDDVFVTNAEILQRGIEAGIANAALIKLNQIGTLTETLQAIDVADVGGYRSVISHRSGETEDTFIADLAVGTGVGQIKTGAPARSERVAKYNRLLRIQEEMGETVEFARMQRPLQVPPADTAERRPDRSNAASVEAPSDKT